MRSGLPTIWAIVSVPTFDDFWRICVASYETGLRYTSSWMNLSPTWIFHGRFRKSMCG